MAPRLHIVFSFEAGPMGGGNQFLKALREQLRSMGEYAESPHDADACLFNSHHRINKALTCRRSHPGLRFIHRIDGPMSLYNAKSDHRDQIVYTANRCLADATVFQSEYSMMANCRLGFNPCGLVRVIHNACDPSLFNCCGSEVTPLGDPIKLVASSWSDNWNKGFEVYRWLDQHLDFTRYEMTFIGRSPIRFRHIRHIPPLGSEELASHLKAGNIFITASRKESCSNALIEALSCGLPAIALRDGGNPELVQDGGELFDRAEEIPFLLDKIAHNYETYRRLIRIQSLSEVTQQYLMLVAELMQHRQESGRLSNRSLVVSRLKLAGRLKWWRIWERLHRILSLVRGTARSAV